MKEKLFGLKKEPINRMLQKMESDFLHEKIKIDYELKSLVEKNNDLRNQLKEIPSKNSIAFEDGELWNLGKQRISNIKIHLQQQKELEIENLRKSYAERMQAIKVQINEIESEIQSTEQIFKKMFQQMVKMVEHSDEVDANNMPKEHKPEAFIENHPKYFVPSTVQEAEDHPEKYDNPFMENREPSVREDESLKNPDASNNNGEADLLEQIDSIKSRYIVGKEAGEDLMAVNGRLIISKSQVITPQVVNVAHREGKLAELIVNMKIAGLGED